MKALFFAIAMALPAAAAASVAMEPQQTLQAPQDTAQSPQVGQGPHHQLFTVKFVLLRRPPNEAPRIVMEDVEPQIVPRSWGSFPGVVLGAWHRDPNTFICYGRGCEDVQR